jgi:trigger factor
MALKREDEEKVDEVPPGTGVAVQASPGEEPSEAEPLQLEVQIAAPSACERRVTVTISRPDIDRYYDEAYSELMPSAAVPGFRTGRAPRKIVEHRFRDDVTNQVKSSLLMDSLEQISEEKRFVAIGEPEFDLEAIEVPEEGPMTFEFSIEVRPDFEMPKWKGLKIERLVHQFSDEDIDLQLEKRLARFGQLVPLDGPAATGDFLTVNVTCTADGRQVAEEQEQVVRLRPTLSFADAQLEGFDELMAGVKAGDERTAEVTLTQDAPHVELRGQPVQVKFEVLEVKKLKLPELTPDFLQEIGNFESKEKLREAVRKDLERQLDYQQQHSVRRQITSMLTKSADWELPAGLLQRQSVRELERAVMELRRSGFSEADIRARENQLRQNSKAATATALKEHFILERIAEEEQIDVEEGDYDKEIYLIALQSGESPRRVRAQLEKRGLMDVLRNQIVERKVLQRVQDEAKFKDQPYEPEQASSEAISLAAGGRGGAIPVASETAAEDAKELDLD